MKYDLNNPIDVKKCDVRYQLLKNGHKRIELTEIRGKRTIRQNSYLHVVISLFAIDTGHTLDEAKTLLKRMSNLYYEKNGVKFLKKTSQMDTKELTDFIDFIREKAALNGCYIPTAEEYLTQQFNIDQEILIHKKYL